MRTKILLTNLEMNSKIILQSTLQFPQTREKIEREEQEDLAIQWVGVGVRFPEIAARITRTSIPDT